MIGNTVWKHRIGNHWTSAVVLCIEEQMLVMVWKLMLEVIGWMTIMNLNMDRQSTN